VKRVAWRWNALYPVLTVGILGLAAVGFATGQIRGIGALLVIPILLFLTACAALTYLTLLVDSRHMHEHDDWMVSPWRYVVFVLVASGLTLLLELGDWTGFALTLVFVALTAVWNLWYVGRRYQYITS
jgi:hypothetical protein